MRILSTLLMIIACMGYTHLHAQENFEVNSVEESSQQQSPQERTSAYSTRTKALTALGRQLFEDTQLSASGKLSCASCHHPQYGFTPDNANAVQKGGALMQLKGSRAVPTLMYLQSTPPFSEHYSEDEGLQPGFDNGPTGGFTWDGRVNTLAEQAKIPLFAYNEMASNPDILVQRIRSTYNKQFIDLFGKNGLQSTAEIINSVILALQTYQQDSTVFAPYTSKFDQVMQGKAVFSPLETQGFKVFLDPKKGNCASCHPAAVVHGAMPQFTDHGYAALGIPRNMQIAGNRNRNYFDLGLCGPARHDVGDEFCGFFKVPTLRNVALKKSFFHNGLVHSLKEAVRFYAERDTAPKKWYRQGKSAYRKYNDLPQKYWGNIETKAPFGQKTGQQPVLSNQDIDAIVAFLNTLTDQTFSTAQSQ